MLPTLLLVCGMVVASPEAAAEQQLRNWQGVCLECDAVEVKFTYWHYVPALSIEKGEGEFGCTRTGDGYFRVRPISSEYGAFDRDVWATNLNWSDGRLIEVRSKTREYVTFDLDKKRLGWFTIPTSIRQVLPIVPEVYDAKSMAAYDWSVLGRSQTHIWLRGNRTAKQHRWLNWLPRSVDLCLTNVGYELVGMRYHFEDSSRMTYVFHEARRSTKLQACPKVPANFTVVDHSAE